ncbi:TPA: hypothetical protein P5L65_003972 [Salmonella enterica subsp. enterica serovar Concord]|uniref:hypothetical protein n=1 Tax=Enterobacteriaceae TaxID=543 RepID=UPI000735729D|nr:MULTISPECIES: hypothetical protein [Enterobacteriaceae]HED0044592.1 hypothetical protein [Salmonella enterica subsp. enterica serovar Kentucky]EHW4068940.1 hypothetical protein [Salmonella enterica subsp. enterica serovar Concord]EIP2948859.1 hypothetical protein [Salmonella enterica]EIZ8992695.1 hypothetical protein [Cronobacter sakazakii]ELQ6035546.1 hypothetical protein [Cronobacter sakazakii]
MSTNNYTDGYFSIDVERGELLHGGISVGRIVLVNGQIYTELDDSSSNKPVVSGPFETREEALDDLWDNRDDANQGSEIFE